MRNKLIFILAIIFGLVAAFGVYQYLGHLKQSYRSSGNFKQVVVPTQPLGPKTLITDKMVKVKDIPVELIQPGTAIAPQDVVGKITRSELYPEEPIMLNRIYKDSNTDGDLALLIPEGQRALTVAVDDVSGVAGLLQPGDHVDIIVTFDYEGEQTSLSTLLLQNIQVLAVGQSLDNTPKAEKKTSSQTVTLSVQPGQATPLTLATERGSIRLMLRSPKDAGTANLPSSQMNNLVR
ncbi:SAF domain protein [Desulforamulus reducens MI-1]|uniref:SAF domain protein n=1 Tax=Desulforamulus reducens (strain ATCC BAA-1160 / DSM 100696 / MI-1) TaxID=349161 RepID=A4J6C8_DESRM|nr:Flp pilus assembly protein CpaB [Desulforamulus reducens]ABO50631.1 SAF domain protein [Desulforamulus reducens MI-1]